jgi:hypothetical protein
MKVRNKTSAPDELKMFYDVTEPFVLQIIDDDTGESVNKLSEETRGETISKALIDLLQVNR